ncbi:membrane protein [Rhodanobacter panaciterrae]|uniref:Membrane protein n=2 Tax=Rhodanobacter panaciterrae TaxID=490572 RepID=A0ABQ2ZJC3_9GAMM|nr:membrane protein [Rhodanobacter panaciterrae]
MMRQPVHARAGLLVGLAGASAVLLGAFGAHALRGVLDMHSRELWQTAVNYHVWHALALALAAGLGRGRSGRFAMAAFAIGIVLFSGSLYALALGAPRWTGIITPIGGLAFIAGWIALGLSLRSRVD